MVELESIVYPVVPLKEYIIKQIKRSEYVAVVVNKKFYFLGAARSGIKNHKYWDFVEDYEDLYIDKVVISPNSKGFLEHRIYVSSKELEINILHDENCWYNANKIYLSRGSEVEEEIKNDFQM